MALPIPKNMMIQSSGRSLSIDFFSDDEVQKIFNEISEKINNDKKRADKHKRYFLLVEFLYRTGGRIDEVLLVKPSDVNLAINSIRMKTLKQGKDKNGIQREKYSDIFPFILSHSPHKFRRIHPCNLSVNTRGKNG